MVDHIHHVVKEAGSSASILVYEEEDEDGETRLRVSPRVSPIPMEGMVKIDGIRVIPSGRQICGMEPTDPRFYIRVGGQ